jgi:hypothetical protein
MEGAARSSVLLLPPGDILVHSEVRDGEYHEDQIGGLAMEVRVYALLRDLLGVLGFAAAACKWGQQHM